MSGMAAVFIRVPLKEIGGAELKPACPPLHQLRCWQMKSHFYLDILTLEAAHLVAIVMTVNITLRMTNNYS